MSQGKGPGRITDGPYANWGTDDDECQMVLTNGSTVKLGQPLCLDVTQFGPDNNVPNNGAALPLCERVVATTSANAGDLFGIVTGISNPPTGVTLSRVAGVPTWTNGSGSTVTLTVQVRQQGWGYVFAGTVSIASSGQSVLVGSRLITSTTQAFAVRGTAAIGATVGIALATAINTTQGTAALNGAPGAAAAAGVISVVPQSMVGIVPNAIVLIDSLASGVQESVSVGSISIPTFSIAIANAHPPGFKITGPASNPAASSVLISTPGTGVTYSGLVAAYININA